MNNFAKPQAPLYSNEKNTYFYPLTTVDQIIMDDDTRLNAKLKKGLSINFSDDDKIGDYNVVINADTLNDKYENELSVAKAVDSDKLGGYEADKYVRQTLPLDIEYGGTGATTVEGARNALGAARAKIYRCGSPKGDLNNIISPGWYWIRVVDCTNTPVGDNVANNYGYLEVITHDTNDYDVLQRYTSYPSGKTWVRSSVNGWQSWRRIDSVDTYPVGSIYMSVNSTSPASIYGGTWEQLKDRFLLGAGSTYTAGNTGGAATHKLTINEMPAHTHSTYSNDGRRCPDDGVEWRYQGMDTSTYRETAAEGGGAAHNNMPPYLVVYMWKRTA